MRDKPADTSSLTLAAGPFNAARTAVPIGNRRNRHRHSSARWPALPVTDRRDACAAGGQSCAPRGQPKRCSRNRLMGARAVHADTRATRRRRSHGRPLSSDDRRSLQDLLRCAGLFRTSPEALHERLGGARCSSVSRPTGVALPCHAARSLPGITFPSVTKFSLHEIWYESAAFNRFRGFDSAQMTCHRRPQHLPLSATRSNRCSRDIRLLGWRFLPKPDWPRRTPVLKRVRKNPITFPTSAWQKVAEALHALCARRSVPR
jgi:hypothetical protein